MSRRVVVDEYTPKGPFYGALHPEKHPARHRRRHLSRHRPIPSPQVSAEASAGPLEWCGRKKCARLVERPLGCHVGVRATFFGECRQNTGIAGERLLHGALDKVHQLRRRPVEEVRAGEICRLVGSVKQRATLCPGKCAFAAADKTHKLERFGGGDSDSISPGRPPASGRSGVEAS